MIGEYVPNFVTAGINGKKLLCLSHDDLEKCDVTKLGHREIIMEAVELLTTLVCIQMSQIPWVHL